MNWKVLGGTISALALCVLVLGLCAGPLADATLDPSQKGRWALECFRGDYSQCGENARHNAFVARWKDYGMYAVIGSGIMLVLGIAILAGSLSSGKKPT